MSPKYRQIVDWIEDRVSLGELLPGDKIESENQICLKFGMSRQTVRRALSELVKDGVLESRQGSGSFIRDHREEKKTVFRSKALPQTVNIITTYIDGYIFLKILQTMASVLEKSGYSVKIEFTNNRHDTERRILKNILKSREKGPLIVEPVMSGLPSNNLEYYRQIQKLGIPILFFHTFYPELDIPHISMDDADAGRKATRYLISKGHRKIGGVFKVDDGQGKSRYRGYMEALDEEGIEMVERRVCWIDTYEQERLADHAERLWERFSDCTAIVCYNDMIASNLIESALKRGIRVPEDLSFIGIDDADIASVSMVPITTVRHPQENLGRKTAEHMIRMIEDPEFEPTYEFEVDVVERESVKDIRTEKEG